MVKTLSSSPTFTPRAAALGLRAPSTFNVNPVTFQHTLCSSWKPHSTEFISPKSLFVPSWTGTAVGSWRQHKNTPPSLSGPNSDAHGQLSTGVWEAPVCPREAALGPLPVCSGHWVRNWSHVIVLSGENWGARAQFGIRLSHVSQLLIMLMNNDYQIEPARHFMDAFSFKSLNYSIILILLGFCEKSPTTTAKMTTPNAAGFFLLSRSCLC